MKTNLNHAHEWCCHTVHLLWCERLREFWVTRGATRCCSGVKETIMMSPKMHQKCTLFELWLYIDVFIFPGSRGGTTTCHQDDTKKEELLLEIQRLRERIKCLETDNASVHNQLSKTQKDVNQRLAEIEMQIHEEEFSFDGNPSPKSSEEEEENNRESFI